MDTKRPDGWDELYLEAYRKEYSGRSKYVSPERAMFEAGADAYREWLKSTAVIKIQERVTGGDVISITLPDCLNGVFAQGCLVFLEEVE